MTLEDVLGLTGGGVPFRLPKKKEPVKIGGVTMIEDVGLIEEAGSIGELTQNCIQGQSEGAGKSGGVA